MQKSTFARTVDELTIQRAKRGDMQAIAAIYEEFAKPCYNLALRISGNGAIAEDVVHDTFVKVMNKIRTYRGDAPFWAWLRQITANTTINVLAKRKWWRSLEELVEAEGYGMPEPGRPDQSGATEHELFGLLSRLSPQARTVLILHDLEGMTHREIGDLFGQTESFSKSVLFRARKQLEEYTGQ